MSNLKISRMKKMKFFALGFIAMDGAMMLNSCSSENAKGPSVSLIAQAGYISSDATVAPGDSIKFKVNIVKGDAGLKSIDFTREAQSLAGYPKTDNLKEGETVFATIAPSNEGVYNYEIVVTDKNDKTGSVKIKITVSSGSQSDLNTYTGVELGAQLNAAGSAYYSASNTVASVNSASAASVDFIYYYGATNKATLAAPSNSDVATVYSAISNWSVKNATKLSLVTVDFDAVTKSSDIPAASGDAVTNLSAGNVIAFETVAGKKGLIKVVSISPADNTGKITLSVKVQK